MNEEAEPVPRWIVTVDDVVQIKAFNMAGVMEYMQMASGVTNDKIEVFSIH